MLLRKCNGLADLLETPLPNSSYHAEFGFSRSNLVRTSSGQPAKLRSARATLARNQLFYWGRSRSSSFLSLFPPFLTSPSLSPPPFHSLLPSLPSPAPTPKIQLGVLGECCQAGPFLYVTQSQRFIYIFTTHCVRPIASSAPAAT